MLEETEADRSGVSFRDRAKRMLADHSGDHDRDALVAEAQVYAILDVGEAVDAQTQELRELRDLLGGRPTTTFAER